MEAIKSLKYYASDKIPSRAYKCPVCGMWHLTSQRNKIRHRMLNVLETEIITDKHLKTWQQSHIKQKLGVPTLPPKQNRKTF